MRPSRVKGKRAGQARRSGPHFAWRGEVQLMPKQQIGLIGLAVMGENLALNIESRGYSVAVFNRSPERTEAFMNDRGKGKRFVAARTEAELVAALEKPRRILLMVKAGAPVDEVINQLVPHLEKGDLIIDGGNSH